MVMSLYYNIAIRFKTYPVLTKTTEYPRREKSNMKNKHARKTVLQAVEHYPVSRGKLANMYTASNAPTPRGGLPEGRLQLLFSAMLLVQHKRVRDYNRDWWRLRDTKH